MIPRPFWLQRIEKAWEETSIVWLSGVRRVGKTTISQSLGADRIRYINCDLPIVADMVASPELFYKNCDRPIVVFDEIHQQGGIRSGPMISAYYGSISSSIICKPTPPSGKFVIGGTPPAGKSTLSFLAREMKWTRSNANGILSSLSQPH